MIDEVELNLNPRVWVKAKLRGLEREAEVVPIIRSFELVRHGVLNVEAEK